MAGWLREQEVRRGDRVLLMLGNVAPLWELTLAAAKIGAVIIPATTLLGPADLADRIERGQVSFVVAASADTGRFADVPGDYTRIAVGEPVQGWLRYSDSETSLEHFEPDEPTRGSDPLLLYFTSGTTARPKLVMHTHVSYPVGHLSTMYWIGLRPGDVHLNVSSPGLGQARLELPVRPVERGRHRAGPRPPVGSPRRRCWTRWSAARWTASARRRRCGGCSSRRTSPRGRCRPGSWSARGSRSTPR